MSTKYLRNEERPEGLLKRFTARLPLSLRRHLFYLRDTGRWGNFRNPKSFGEKMQWRIINDRRKRLSIASDRLAARAIVEEIVAGSGQTLHLPALIGYGATSNMILQVLRKAASARQLPTRWVLKPNNSSGQVLVTHGDPDWGFIEETLKAWSASSRLRSLHWMSGYAAARAGFIAEAWVGPSEEAPLQWNCTIINNAVAFYAIDQRVGDIKLRECRDASWGKVPLWGHSTSVLIGLDAPPPYKHQIDAITTLIARDWDFVRVDLYYAEGKVWLSEITPYPSEGLIRTTPGGKTYDERCGALWSLPPIASVREGAS